MISIPVFPFSVFLILVKGTTMYSTTQAKILDVI